MRITLFLLATLLLAGTAVSAAPQGRDAILKAAAIGKIRSVIKALNDPDPVIRRTALRSLQKFGKSAIVPLEQTTLANPDPVMRRGALVLLTQLVSQEKMLDILEKVIRTEKSPIVRRFVIEIVSAKRPAAGRSIQILAAALKDADPETRAVINKALWPFYRKTTLLRERHNWDSPIEQVLSMQLPFKGWKFMKDPAGTLHKERCFAPEYDISRWRAVEIGKWWEYFIGLYDGIGWYRLEFKTPAAPREYNAVELSFGAVDEVAWVWLNGVYIGQHDIGKSGWNVPFSLDVTHEIKWNTKNVLVVRVFDSTGAGGIWKPIKLDILK